MKPSLQSKIKEIFSNYAAEIKQRGIEFKIVKHSDLTKTEYKDEVTMARFDSIPNLPPLEET